MRKLLDKWQTLKIHDDKRHYGDVVDLIERHRLSAKQTFDGVPTVYYEIYLHNTNHKVGKCDLRLKNDERMYYYGNVGYNIIESERGHHYAYYACKVLFDIARDEFGYKTLYLTCDPDNKASYKTLVKLGGKLIETKEVPYDHELYEKGEFYKCIFRYRIDINGENK